jgi:hypothetical protein
MVEKDVPAIKTNQRSLYVCLPKMLIDAFRDGRQRCSRELLSAPGDFHTRGEIDGLERQVEVESHPRRLGPSNDSATQPEGWTVPAAHPSFIFNNGCNYRGWGRRRQYENDSRFHLKGSWRPSLY